jgi:hypothetical protein
MSDQLSMLVKQGLVSPDQEQDTLAKMPIPLPKPRPMAAAYGTGDNSDRINDDVPLDHPARLARMNEMLRAKTISQYQYDDYMKSIGK